MVMESVDAEMLRAAVAEGERLRSELETAMAAIEELRRDAQAASRAKADFMARMTHEMRTPLSAIIGLANLSMPLEKHPKVSEYLTKIRSSAQALLGVVDDITDFSQLEKGLADLVPVPFHLDDVLARLSGRFAEAARKKGLALAVRLDPRLPLNLVGDHIRLEHILGQLVGNALKFTERGEVEVAVDLVGRDGRTVRLAFCVRDTGIGMEPETIPAMLESFTQADGSLSRPYGGTGLGLALVGRGVALLGGELSVTSQVGRGSLFSFQVPFLEDAPSDVPERLRGRRILVVDDDAVARTFFRDTLQECGCLVETAASGAEALNRLRQGGARFDLVLMDWMLPDGNGLDWLGRIRRLPGPLAGVLTLVASCHAREDLPGMAERAGAAGFLLKPVDRDVLLDAVTAALDREIPAREAAGSQARQPLAGSLILLVEDNAINQQVARETLKIFGASVDVAQNGREALEMVRATGYDLVLMDVQMPVMDGLTATRHIRAMPGGADLPIVALTAHALAEDRERCLEAGMNDYLTKPIDADRLLATLRQWILAARVGPSGASGKGRAVPAASSPAPAVTVSPTLDRDTALARMGGNERLLYSVLSEFTRDYAGSAAALSRLLAAGDLDGARRLAHTVKGVAGNIAAEALVQAARDLETGLARGERPLPETLDAFGEALARTVEAALGLAPSLDAGTPGLDVGWRVLLVDDAKLNRAIFSQILRSAGHEVVTADNGKEACRMLFGEKAQGRPFDCILMDIEMPEMDGLRATRIIRGLLAACANPPCPPGIPIVALTSHEVERERERCLAAGMDECLPKAFEHEDLLTALGRIMTGRDVRARRSACPAPTAGGGAAMTPLLRCLAAHLAEGSIRADEDLAVLRETFVGRPAPPELEALAAAVERYDFAAALDCLTRLAPLLGVDPSVLAPRPVAPAPGGSP